MPRALHYRSPLTKSGRFKYAAWIRALRGKSGVYVFRTPAGAVVYVGESHSGKLYKTLTRHFSEWGREKKWWQGAFVFGDNTDPGRTYDADELLVAVRVLPAGEAYRAQIDLIERLKPADNIIGQAHAPESADDSDLFDFLD